MLDTRDVKMIKRQSLAPKKEIVIEFCDHGVSLRGDENVLKLILVVVAQPCEYS